MNQKQNKLINDNFKKIAKVIFLDKKNYLAVSLITTIKNKQYNQNYGATIFRSQVKNLKVRKGI